MSTDNKDDWSIRDTFARNLRVLLAERDISQAELAKRTGLAASTISSYLSGDRYPRPQQLQQIARALDMTTAELTGLRPADETDKQELLRLFTSLPAPDQDTVLSLCRFLVSKHSKSAPAKQGRTSVVIARVRKDSE